ncbi:MAG: SAM-dependent chlorinase/fluorinase [Nanoarchaeota archaeon]|nr:SAM-dependent chlorinase/fluorinase [Nanoarchaeota archaeon]
MIVTLTDFGDSPYLGVMRGVILSKAPKAKIIDLFNKVDSFNVKEGAWVLATNYKYFPEGTIFLCVVDPGVGSTRECIIVETENYFFVGPDNGLMFPAANSDRIDRIVRIEYLKNIRKAAPTFHGRDIFAMTAAELERGVNVDEMGEFIHKMQKLEFYNKDRVGEVVRIDKFGNIITTVPHKKKDEYTLEIKGKKKKIQFYKNYSDAKKGKLFVVDGSAKTLEISMNQDCANDKLKLKIGDKVKLS